MDWEEINAELAQFADGTTESLRDALARLYEGIAATPDGQLQDFLRLTEADLNDGLSERAKAVVSGQVEIAASADWRTTLLDAGRLLRAIEAALVEDSRYLESDLAEDLEDAWRTGDGRHYVVPRLTPLASVDWKPFLRRALRHHRVLPTSIGEFAVRLHRATLAADAHWAELERASPDRRYGAAFFPGLKAHLKYPEHDTFTVSRLSGCDIAQCLSGHLEEARSGECCAVVWGELTMPDASIEHIRTTLAGSGLRGCGPLRYLVAGSWHVEIDGKMRNQCRVLDGYGEPVCEVLKWAKFVFARKMEAIEPGQEIHVLVGEGELAVVAICRDFLQETGEVPYKQLNVDVALVPSMIVSIEEHSTLPSHAATANSMRVRYGTRTVVVAQPAEAGEGGVGQLMGFPRRPLEEGYEIVAGAWKICHLGND